MTGPGRLAERLWRTFTSVDVAVAQIIVLAVMATIGLTLEQLPGFAARSATDRAVALERIHARYDATLGPGAVELLARLGMFEVFTSWWFSLALVVLLVSIVVCTIDRTPRLWRAGAELRVVQPDEFYDPRLPDRALLPAIAAASVEAALRRNRFSVRTATAGEATYLYGDRNRWVKLATLLTHLGLILFLVAAAVTSRFGFEAGLVVTDGGTTTVQPIGTPGLLVARNNGFEAPRRDDGSFADFTTDLSIFRDGEEIARRTIRVNEPLAVAGFTFHQNGFGPAPDVTIRAAGGALLWAGPIALTDSVDGRPYGILGVPGRDYGLQLLLERDPTSGSALVLVLPYRVVGTEPDGSDRVQTAVPFTVAVGERVAAPGLDIEVALEEVAAYTLLIAKRDPGQGFVWLAFAALISGILVTFHLPRRRVWARLDAGGLALVGRSDRYVDFDREFGRLLDDLVRARG